MSNPTTFFSFTIYDLKTDSATITLADGTPMHFTVLGDDTNPDGVQVTVTPGKDAEGQEGGMTVSSNKLRMSYAGQEGGSVSGNILLASTSGTMPSSVTVELEMPEGCTMVMGMLNTVQVTTSGSYTLDTE